LKKLRLIIHNAPFDVGFINHELLKLRAAKAAKIYKNITEYCSVIDTLVMARQKHPGQKNNLDALCKRYGVDNSQRDLHGALLDSEILADVYLFMTGGQKALSLGGAEDSDNKATAVSAIRRLVDAVDIPVLAASAIELESHEKKLQSINKASQGNCIWLKEPTNS